MTADEIRRVKDERVHHMALFEEDLHGACETDKKRCQHHALESVDERVGGFACA